MFERTRIKWATARAVDRSPLSKADGDYLYHAVTNSPMLPAAIMGMKTNSLDSAPVAVAYLLSAIVDATSRTDDAADHHRGVIAEQTAYSAMQAAGATHEEAKAVIDECVAMHARSHQKLVSKVMREETEV